jgi:DNA-binding beta-propeller fold protein YncE
MKNVLAGAAGFALLFSVLPVSAEIVVSANDGKQMRPGDTVTAPEPDSISILSVKDGKVKLLGSVGAPAAMIGPPAAVAVTRDSRLAIVTSCQILQGEKLEPADTVSLVDLSVPANPRVIQTMHAGPGASGVSISPNGKLVLVASTGDDSVTAFTLTGRTLAQVGKVQFEKGSSPTDVVFTPNGKTAVAVGRGNSKLMLMTVNGSTVTATGRSAGSSSVCRIGYQ